MNARDLVTESDVECQRLIKEIILTEFPSDVFLGEEDVDLTSSDNSFASSGALRKALGIGSDDGNDDRLIFVVVSVRDGCNVLTLLPLSFTYHTQIFHCNFILDEGSDRWYNQFSGWVATVRNEYRRRLTRREHPRRSCWDYLQPSEKYAFQAIILFIIYR